MKVNSKINVMRQCPRDKGNNLENNVKTEDGPRRVTRALVKVKVENHTGKLVWGFFAGWWPGKYIRDNDYRISHAMYCVQNVAREYRFHCVTEITLMFLVN